MIRPDDLEETNYFEYFKNYEIVLNNSRRKLPLKAKKYKDNNNINTYINTLITLIHILKKLNNF